MMTQVVFYMCDFFSTRSTFNGFNMDMHLHISVLITIVGPWIVDKRCSDL